MTDLETIKARLTAAIPGPWYVDESLRGVEAQAYGYPVEVVAWTGRAEAVLIAHAPADIGALVAEVERLREARDAERKRADSLALAYREQQGVNDAIKIEAERHRRIADEAITCIESAEAERAAVVAWLRKERTYGTDDLLGAGFATVLGILAEAVEKGEHIREGEE